MGVTSSGLLDEEREAGADSTVEVEDSTLVASGERNIPASTIIGRPVAGTPNVCYRGPTTYTLEGTVKEGFPTTTTTTTTTTT